MTGALADLMRDGLARPGSRVDETSGLGLSGSELDAHGGIVAGLLRTAGVRPDEPVHVAIGNRASDLGTLLGIWKAGAVAVPIHHSAAPLSREAVERATRARFLLDGHTLKAIAADPPPDRPLLEGGALVVFTSGSTGAPKGVVLGHDALARKLSALDRLLRFCPDDVVVVPLQLTFIFGIWTSLLAIRSGAPLVLVQKFAPATLARLLAAEATVLAAVPTMLRALLAEGAPTAARLRAVLTGGEALSPSLAQAVTLGWPSADLVDLYGLTETGSCDFCHRPSENGRAASIGVPTEGVEFRIVGVDGMAAAPGAVGELQIRAACGMLGYLDDPELTRVSFNADFFRTGDLARLRPDGRVELVGRSKEIISRGGNKISPLEIENALCAHTHVAAALCAGVADQRLGEAIHAVVVPTAGATLTADELRSWVSVNLERYKVPDVIVFSDTLPSGATGKASRSMVSALTLQHGNAAASSN
jgi:long-chain acyl-CoA synthetase